VGLLGALDRSILKGSEENSGTSCQDNKPYDIYSFGLISGGEFFTIFLTRDNNSKSCSGHLNAFFSFGGASWPCSGEKGGFVFGRGVYGERPFSLNFRRERAHIENNQKAGACQQRRQLLAVVVEQIRLQAFGLCTPHAVFFCGFFEQEQRVLFKNNFFLK